MSIELFDTFCRMFAQFVSRLVAVFRPDQSPVVVYDESLEFDEDIYLAPESWVPHPETGELM